MRFRDLRTRIQVGHPARVGPKSAQFQERLKNIWTWCDYFFKFINWVIAASVVQFAADQTHNFLFNFVAVAMWLLLVILTSSIFDIRVFIGVARQDGFP